MNHIFRITIAFLLVGHFSFLAPVTPLIVPRSQSVDAVRDIVGLTRYINLYDPDNCLYGVWAFTFEYQKSTNPNSIARSLFGTDLVNDPGPTIIVSGSQVGDRNATDWLADYFGLPTDFQSTLTFKPQAHSYIFDVEYYIGLDEWLEGLYFRFHAPLVGTNFNLNFNENVTAPGVNGYVAGYFGTTAIARDLLLTSFEQFASLGMAPNLTSAGVTFAPLTAAKISNQHHSSVRLAELQAAFGWNFIQEDDHHFGLNIRGYAPCGTRPEGTYLFEPIVGNGHHWELGLGVTCHFDLLTDFCKDRYIGFYFDANLTHMFGARQTRTFDLADNPLSRYMLVELLGTPVQNLFVNNAQGLAAGGLAPTGQFQNVYTPLANVTTFDVEVRVAAQVDAVAMIDIQWGNWNFDFGYDYWAKTCQNIKPCAGLPFAVVTNYALKGDAFTYGFVADDAVNLPAGLTPGDPIPLSATESLATIHSGTNTPVGTPFNTSQYQNPGIDQTAYKWAMVSTNDNTDQIVIMPGDDGGMSTQQLSSQFPVTITSKQIDYEAAETKGDSNRIFAHVSYNPPWCACDWQPFIGVGGFAEFAHHSTGNCSEPYDDGSCMSCAFSQWGVWIKGGVAF